MEKDNGDGDEKEGPKIDFQKEESPNTSFAPLQKAG